jgi:hypothetical protein
MILREGEVHPRKRVEQMREELLNLCRTVSAGDEPLSDETVGKISELSGEIRGWIAILNDPRMPLI